MRNKLAKNNLTVQAVAGTHVVFLAFNLPKSKTQNLMGFAIQRRDVTEDEHYWLRSIKTFPGAPISATEDVSSHEGPFQTFQWADYSAKPDHDYEYRVVAMTGTPGHLNDGPEVTLPIRTEKMDPVGAIKHGVYFNRGAIASQAYAKRFGMKHPDEDPAAQAWLARDLLPGILRFIDQAQAGQSLHCALYEINFRRVLDALLAAKARGVNVQVLFGATPGSDTTTTNQAALIGIGSPVFFKPRTHAKIAHNKFIVFSTAAGPRQVWTGSTNLSTNAFFGQFNVGHAVENEAVAKTYKSYWDQLDQDPSTATLRTSVATIAPLDTASTAPRQVTFSPVKGLAVYNYYQTLAKSAQDALFMTYPFGMSKEFRAAYDANDGVLRYALLDKYVNGGTKASRDAVIADTKRIRGLPNVGMALGEGVFTDDVDGWRRERPPIGSFVDWVHTKFMIIDPLGAAPIVVSGSANWSEPSTNENDENMIVFRNDPRVAHIFFTEFMRVFAHHRFREALKRHVDAGNDPNDWKPNELMTKPSDWVPKHYDAGQEYDIRRQYFAS